MNDRAEHSKDLAAAQKIADFLSSKITFEHQLGRACYGHMGATLTDTVLQAGLSYRSVVLPRVRYVLTAYPDAKTTTSFWEILCAVGPHTVLRWSHPEKIGRLNRLIDLLRARGVETEPELAEWLSSIAISEELLSLKGIGPKTVDYLKILVGIPTVAVDRHVRTLFKTLELDYDEYDDLRSLVCRAAGILGVQPHVLDGVVWQFFSGTREIASQPQNGPHSCPPDPS